MQRSGDLDRLLELQVVTREGSHWQPVARAKSSLGLAEKIFKQTKPLGKQRNFQCELPCGISNVEVGSN